MLVLLLGCLDHELAPGADAGTFVAMQSDFEGFLAWERTDVAAGDTGGHGAVAKTVYRNLARGGAARFPVGTLLVKVTPTDEGEDIHAMAKRGDGYNADGAVGWEWFDLVLAEDGTPVINWRGVAPPDGEGYSFGADEDTAVEADCNACHGGAHDNDYVFTVEP